MADKSNEDYEREIAAQKLAAKDADLIGRIRNAEQSEGLGGFIDRLGGMTSHEQCNEVQRNLQHIAELKAEQAKTHATLNKLATSEFEGQAVNGLIQSILACDMSGVRTGELALAHLASGPAFEEFAVTMRADPALRPLIVDATESTLLIRRPDGKHVHVLLGAEVATVRSSWVAGALFDERDFESDAGLRGTIQARLLPGARLIIVNW